MFVDKQFVKHKYCPRQNPFSAAQVLGKTWDLLDQRPRDVSSWGTWRRCCPGWVMKAQGQPSHHPWLSFPCIIKQSPLARLSSQHPVHRIGLKNQCRPFPPLWGNPAWQGFGSQANTDGCCSHGSAAPLTAQPHFSLLKQRPKAKLPETIFVLIFYLSIFLAQPFCLAICYRCHQIEAGRLEQSNPFPQDTFNWTGSALNLKYPTGDSLSKSIRFPFVSNGSEDEF